MYGMKMIREQVKRFSKKLPWYFQDICVYFLKFNRFPNIKNPKTFNEKVLYRKNFKMNERVFSILADKFLVRSYVTRIIGDSYLIPLLYSTNEPDSLREFDWGKQDAIVKPNHGAGMYKIVKHSISSAQVETLITLCHSWLDTDFSQVQREIHYKDIPPMILVEQLLGDGVTALPDYKFHLFRNADGDFDFVLQVITDRFTGKLTRYFYVNNLTQTFGDLTQSSPGFELDLDNLMLALSLSKQLGADFNYVRIDWYIYHGCLYFGEITFTPVAGFGTGYGRSLDRLMGDMWQYWS